MFACHCEQMLTQCVENACGQANTQKHKGPASRPQAPCFHGVELVLLLKDFLVGTKSIQQSQQLKCTTNSSCGCIYVYHILMIIHRREINLRKHNAVSSRPTCAESSSRYRISSLSPDLVLKAFRASPLCRATTVT